MKSFQEAISAKYSMIYDVYAVADELKLNFEQAGDDASQNMFYSCWTHDSYVGKVLVLLVNGCIMAYAIHAPGAMHDYTIT